MKRTILALAIAVFALAAVAGVAGAAADYYTVTAFQQDQHVEEFRRTGNVTVHPDGLMLSTTIAESHETVGLSGFHPDVGYVYFQIDYDGEIPRTVRFKIPDAYFEGRPATISAENADEQMSIKSVAGKSYSIVEIHLDGQTNAVFQLSKAVGTYFETKDKINHIVNETTGWQPPSLFSSTSWTYVDSSKWSNDTYTLSVKSKASNVVLQYDDAAGPTEAWIAVPDCENTESPDVCRYTSNGNVTLHSTMDVKPTVRYRVGGGPVATVKAAVNDLLQAPQRFLNDIRKLIPFL